MHQHLVHGHGLVEKTGGLQFRETGLELVVGDVFRQALGEGGLQVFGDGTYRIGKGGAGGFGEFWQVAFVVDATVESFVAHG